MVMSPLDLRNQEFNRAFRGYSEDEVDSFLEVLAEDYETIFRENINLKEQLSQKDESMWKYRDIEETLKSTLLLAQKTAEDVRSSADKEAGAVVANANKEAELVLKEAARQAEIVIKEAHDKAQAILGEYSSLQKQAHLFKANLRSTLQAQLDMLKEPSAIGEIRGVEQAVAATKSVEPVSPTPINESKQGAVEPGFQQGVSEDTLILEPVKVTGEGLLKEPRYNPGNQAD